VLVVGTTTDYVDHIRGCRAGQALFLTDPAARRKAREPAPGPEEEILCELNDPGQVGRRLADHLDRWKIALAGVACFDDESMALAARLAQEYGLPYPSLEAVANCRDKYRSKRLWEAQELATPAAGKVASPEAAAAFLNAVGAPVVLKPIGGSGSELMFRCENEADCVRHFSTIAEGLAQRHDSRLYQPFAADGPGILAEALVAGEEYSCDFVLENGRAAVLRLTHKVGFAEEPFGTAKAYSLPDVWPEVLEGGQLETILQRSARALGIERAICMLDFFLADGRVVLLEMAPRPGGDCLPPLMRCCCQLDVLQLMLDFACRKPLDWKPAALHPPMVGLRLHAPTEGILVGIDDRELRRDPRVREIHLTHQPGHIIKRPPEDYDAWLLGHVLFTPDPHRDVPSQCRELCGRLRIEVQ
jgi:glutathione synthase/RimK-type ligase-like ATP-grasp enzyme